MPQISNNTHEKRFELVINGQTAYANYRLEGSQLFIDYVFAPDALRGSGAAGQLMQQIKDLALTSGWEITPICGYAASWLKRNA
jgi:predicted GNAT family acetyltransferase